MRVFFAAAVLLVALLLVGAGGAQDTKEVTLKGTITCLKCDLGKSDSCATIIVVKGDDKKDVIYLFDSAGNKQYHKNVCTSPRMGSVTVVVSEKDGKKTIAVKDVKYDEK